MSLPTSMVTGNVVGSGLQGRRTIWLFSWSNGLWLLALAWLVAFVFFQSGLFWLHLPYDQVPDQDLFLAYNALIMNAGLPQEYFDHTGYAYFLLLGPWFELLHAVGALPVATLTTLPHAADHAASEVAWQQIIEAGRLFTAVIVATFSVVLAILTGRLVGDRRIGFVSGFALAASAGTIDQIGIMRTEPLSSLLAVTAIVLVALAGKSERPGGRLLLIGGAAFLAVLAVLTKVQAFILLASLPVVAIAFGRPQNGAAETPAGRRRRAIVLAIAAIVLAIPAAWLVVTGFANVGVALHHLRPVAGGLFAYYQGWFALYVLVCVAIYAALWKVPPEDAVAAVAALTIGTSLGLLVLLIRYNLQNVIVVTHPIEQMFVFSVSLDPTLGKQSTVLGGLFLAKLGAGAWFVISSLLSTPLGDNVYLLEAFVVVSLIIGSWMPNRRWVVQAGLLLFISLALQSVFYFRYYDATYHVYSDPLTIIATAIVLARFRSHLLSGLGALAVLCGLSAFVLWGLYTERAWSSSLPRDPTGACRGHDAYFKRLDPFPFCPDGLG